MAAKPKKAKVDPQELEERTEAAFRYSQEDETHFVTFLNSCVKASVDAMRDIRTMQNECWRVFNEEEPFNFAFKEQWQSRVTYPKPYKLVQSGNAIIRKIFEMEFLTVEDKRNATGADFWKELLMIQLGRNYANFPVCFADSVGMALAIGQSMEMVPYWIPGKGLRFAMVEPAKIHRDPDSVSRQPWSGEWWIHQEHMGWHHLKYMEKQGRYQNVPDFGGYTTGQDPNATPEEIARRKNMLFSKTSFHKGMLTLEYWGTILSPKGEILLEDATYTVAADRVISPPEPGKYPSIRWPGVGFSAMPHLLRFDGRGVVQGIRSLWYLMCNLMSLHADHLNWVVNPMLEMDIHSLVDEDDTDVFPGKVYQTHSTQQGQQVVRPIDFRSQVGDIMAILNFFDQRHQDGGLLDYATMGLPGYRAEVTMGEAAQNLDQSMILVGAMGKNVEDGALHTINAAIETITINMTYDELVAYMGREVADKYRVEVSEENPTGLMLPSIGSGTFHISGISGLMKDQEILKHLNEMMPMFLSPQSPFLPYLEPYYFLKSWEKRTNLRDEMVVIPEEKAKAIMDAQQAQQEAAIGHQAGVEEAAAAAKAAEADKHAAAAEKFRGEGAAKQAQAGLFDAKALAEGGVPTGTIPPGGAPPEEGAAPAGPAPPIPLPPRAAEGGGGA